MHTTFGRHLLAEYHECREDLLNDLEELEAMMHDAAVAAEVGVVQSVSHRFSPQGVTVVLVLEESHMSIHTWPEAGYAAVDFYTCGQADPRLAHMVLEASLGATNAEVALIHRGMRTAPKSMQKVDVETSSVAFSCKPQKID